MALSWRKIPRNIAKRRFQDKRNRLLPLSNADTAPAVAADAWFSSTSGLAATPDRIPSSATTYAPTLLTGPATITPAAIASQATVHAPTLAMVLPVGTIASGAVAHAPTLTPGAAVVTPGAIAAQAVVRAPTLAPGAATLLPGHIVSGATARTPTLLPGAATLAMPFISSTATAWPPAGEIEGSGQEHHYMTMPISRVLATAMVTAMILDW